jgi:hypothetical protein
MPAGEGVQDERFANYMAELEQNPFVLPSDEEVRRDIGINSCLTCNDNTGWACRCFICEIRSVNGGLNTGGVT